MNPELDQAFYFGEASGFTEAADIVRSFKSDKGSWVGWIRSYMTFNGQLECIAKKLDKVAADTRKTAEEIV